MIFDFIILDWISLFSILILVPVRALARALHRCFI